MYQSETPIHDSFPVKLFLNNCKNPENECDKEQRCAVVSSLMLLEILFHVLESYVSEICFIVSSPFKMCHLHMYIMYIVFICTIVCVFVCFIEGHFVDWLY